MNGTPQVFSNVFLVCIEIHKYNMKGETIWFQKLVENLEGSVSKGTVSKCLNYLFDKGMIDAEWEKNPETERWVRSLKVAGEFRGFVEGLVRASDHSRSWSHFLPMRGLMR